MLSNTLLIPATQSYYYIVFDTGKGLFIAPNVAIHPSRARVPTLYCLVLWHVIFMCKATAQVFSVNYCSYLYILLNDGKYNSHCIRRS